MDEMDIRTPLAEFGNVLREERVRCGYTVDEVASRLKITSRMVRAIEEGKGLYSRLREIVRHERRRRARGLRILDG